MALLEIPDKNLKMLREALCISQMLVNQPNSGIAKSVGKHLQTVIDAVDVHRPLGLDGKHGNHHTETCGCSDKE